MAWPPIDFNKLLQEAYTGKGDPMDWYQLMARGRISRPQHDLLVSAQPQSFGQRIGFSDRPTLQAFKQLAENLKFPAHSPNASANPEQAEAPGTQPAIPTADLPAAYPNTASPALIEATAGMPVPSTNPSATPVSTQGITPTGEFMSGGSTFLPVLPQGLQQQMEQLYGNTLSRLNSNFGPNAQSGINPILAQARKQFNEETIPSIANRFTSMGNGAQRGSGFQAALGRAGSNLESDLAALQSRYNLAERQQLLNSLPGLNPYEQIYNPEPIMAGAQQPANVVQGWGRNLLPALGRSLLGAAGGAISGFGTGGIPGAATGGILGALGGGASAITPSPQDEISNITSRVKQSRNTTAAPLSRSSLSPAQQTLLDDISRRAGPGVQLSPAEIQAIQAITGGAPNAAQDFQLAYQQPTIPLTYAQRMKLRKAAAKARRAVI